MARNFDMQDQVCDAPDFRWTLTPFPVEIVNLTTIPTAQQIIDRIHLDDHTRASSEKLTATIEDIYQLLGYKLFREIDLVLELLELKKAAPEYSVGLLRTTSKNVRHIHNWQQFLGKVQNDLTERRLEPKKILIGLM